MSDKKEDQGEEEIPEDVNPDNIDENWLDLVTRGDDEANKEKRESSE